MFFCLFSKQRMENFFRKWYDGLGVSDVLNEKTRLVFELYSGTLPVKVAAEYGISNGTLQKAYRRGEIEKPYRGVYVLPESLDDDLLAMQSIYSKGIYSYETALYLNGLGSFVPFKYYMTFPRGYSNSSFEENMISPSWITEKYYEIGLTELPSLVGNPLRVYDKERTILDILGSKRILPYLVEEAVYDYYTDSDADFDRLVHYAEQMKRTYLLKRWNEYLVKFSKNEKSSS